MTIPDVISFSSVIVPFRERSELNGIASLADSIADDGLIQPLVITNTNTYIVNNEVIEPEGGYQQFMLIAGGRRHVALSLLIEDGRLEPFLFHAETSSPGRPGFILRGETSPLRSKILELKENLDRLDLDWRDEVRALVKAYRLGVEEGKALGIEETLDNPHALPPELLEVLNRDFGAMLRVGYQDIDAALKVYKFLETSPKVFAQCSTLKDAYTVFLKEDSKYIARLFAARGMGKLNELKGKLGAGHAALPQLPPRVAPAQLAPTPENGVGIVLLDENHTPSQPLAVEIPLSSSFFLTNGLDFMEQQPPGFCHHIVCDPDYAIGVDVLNSHPNNRIGIMADGVAQQTVEASLLDMRRFITLAFRALPEAGGYCIFWYALDHHEKMQTWCREAGFNVQPHPLIWNKIDYTGRSNTAPEHQWPKSVEFAMVCRKPGCRLTKVQTSNVYSQDAKSVTKALNHAFAKPFEVWRWIYRAIAIKGQRVFDPFVGSGSSAISAILEGLAPIGCEIQEDNFNTLTLNLRAFYRKHMGEHVTFT